MARRTAPPRRDPRAPPPEAGYAGAPPPARVPRRVRILGCPLDLGAERRGVDMGPSAIRRAHLHRELAALGHDVVDGGNVYAPERETKRPGDESLKYLPEIVGACEQLAKRVEQSLRKGEFPLVLGGDHSIAMGTLGGLARARRRVGVLYFDAHGDFNTHETTPSGNIHGMSLAAAVGLGDPRLVNVGKVAPKVRAANAVLLGVRNLDPGERRLIQKAGITVYTMRDIDERGLRKVMHEAIATASRGTDALHVSFDTDVVDPRDAPGTGTPHPGGLSFREAHLAMELVAEAPKFACLEVVEVNPLLDERNRTGELAVGLIASALGRRIL